MGNPESVAQFMSQYPFQISAIRGPKKSFLCFFWENMMLPRLIVVYMDLPSALLIRVESMSNFSAFSIKRIPVTVIATDEKDLKLEY